MSSWGSRCCKKKVLGKSRVLRAHYLQLWCRACLIHKTGKKSVVDSTLHDAFVHSPGVSCLFFLFSSCSLLLAFWIVVPPFARRVLCRHAVNSDPPREHAASCASGHTPRQSDHRTAVQALCAVLRREPSSASGGSHVPFAKYAFKSGDVRAYTCNVPSLCRRQCKLSLLLPIRLVCEDWPYQ